MPLKVRFPNESKCSDLLETRTLTSALPISGYLSLPRKHCRAQLTKKITELKVSSLINEQSFCQWTKPLRVLAVLTLGMGDLKAFAMQWEAIQGILPARDGWMCERGLRDWKELFKYLYSPSLLVSCPEMKSS